MWITKSRRYVDTSEIVERCRKMRSSTAACVKFIRRMLEEDDAKFPEMLQGIVAREVLTALDAANDAVTEVEVVVTAALNAEQYQRLTGKLDDPQWWHKSLAAYRKLLR